MKILRTIGILTLVAGLVLGGTGSALAQGPPNKRGLFGTVSSVDTIAPKVEYLISLETELGTVDVTINGTGTKYMVPGETRGPKDLDRFLEIVDEDGDGNLEELVDRKMAVLVKDIAEDGNPPDFTATAIRLMLIPSPSSLPSHAHRVGIVDEFDPDSGIKIIDKDGEPHTFTINEDTVYRPSAEDGGISELTGEELIEAIIGGFVTVVTKGDPKLPDPIAKAIVLHDELPDWAPEP